jgi:Domain of unknown function (DUF3854)
MLETFNLAVLTRQPHDFYAEFTQGSGIAPALYAAAIKLAGDLESDAVGEISTPIHEALNWRYSRFGLRANQSLWAALLLNEDGACWQAKLASPKLDRKTGKSRKYETPIGNGSRAFLPPIPPVIRQQIEQRYKVKFLADGAFWDFIAAHPEIPIVLTEGGKKSLAALSQGYVTIALYGINAGVSKYETIGGDRIRRLKPELIPDLQRFAVEGRRFILAFDQDAKPQTRYRVEGALADLSWHLEQAGAIVNIASWDGEADHCKGLDDLIVNAGVEAWHSAYDQAVPANEWRIGRQLAAAVKRQPDLKIGDREFGEVVEQLPKSGIVALWGGKGTGKSKAIGLLSQSEKWLAMVPLQSLGRSAAESLGGVFINDGDQVRSQVLKDGQPVDGVAVCYPSMMKLVGVESDVLILDETTAGLEFLLSSPLTNQGGIRPLLLREFERRVRMARLVILADADLNEDVIRYIELIRGERSFLVKSDRQPLNYTAHLIDGTRNQAIGMFLQQLETAPSEKILWLNCDVKAIVDQLDLMLSQQNIKCLKITSDTSGGELEQEFLTSKGKILPRLAAQNIRVILSSPSVTQGFSVEHHTELIDSVWGIYTGCSISAHSIAQAPDRIRSNQVPRFLHIAKKGKAYSRLSRAESAGKFLREFKSVQSATARLVRHALKPETIAQVDKLDWESENLKLLTAFEVRRNRGMRHLRETVTALLRQEGKRVEILKPPMSQTAAKEIEHQLKASRNAILLTHAKSIATAKALTELEAKSLEHKSRNHALSLDELNALERFYIAQFYRLEQIQSEDVMADRQGRTRQEVRNLEMVLNGALAEAKSAGSIEQNPETPQDWSKAVVQHQLLDMSGARQLISEIYSGAVVELEPEHVGSIASYLQSHPQEFQLAFGFSNIHKVSPMQAVTTVLNWCGIKRSVHRRRIEGGVLRIYRIDQERLTFLQTLLAQRGEPDPALLVNHQIRGAGSDQNSSCELSKADQGYYLSEKRKNKQTNSPPNFCEVRSA